MPRGLTVRLEVPSGPGSDPDKTDLGAARPTVGKGWEKGLKKP